MRQTKKRFEEKHIKSLKKTDNGVLTCKVQRNPTGKKHTHQTKFINHVNVTRRMWYLTLHYAEFRGIGWVC